MTVIHFFLSIINTPNKVKLTLSSNTKWKRGEGEFRKASLDVPVRNVGNENEGKLFPSLPPLFLSFRRKQFGDGDKPPSITFRLRSRWEEEQLLVNWLGVFLCLKKQKDQEAKKSHPSSSYSLVQRVARSFGGASN